MQTWTAAEEQSFSQLMQAGRMKRLEVIRLYRPQRRISLLVKQSSGMLPPMCGANVLRAAAAIALSTTSLFLSGCDDLAKQAGYEKSPAAKQPPLSTPTRRFVQYSHNDDIAFDTQTGQLCRTWDWSPVAPEPKRTPEGMVPERPAGELTPTCLSLFKQYPTAGNAGVGIAQDSSPN